MTGEEFSTIAREAAAKRSGGSAEEAGPITAFTSDAEIAKRAGKISHTLGVPVSLVVALLNLERRVAQLEQKKTPPRYPRMETRIDSETPRNFALG
jgi:hypothetical protein